MNLKLKFPYWYFEHCSVFRKDKEIIVKSEENEINIPFDGIGFILFGPGCNITSNVISHMNKNKVHVAISSSQQKPSGIVSCSGDYGNGKWAVSQAKTISNERIKLKSAKRFLILKYPHLRINIEAAKRIRELQGIEGPAMKNIYRKVFGSSFKRIHSDNEEEVTTNTNYKINVANNMLYCLMQVICVEYGLSPHLGIIHGEKRNSFIYDLADIFKKEDYYKVIQQSKDIKSVLINLSEFLFEKQIFKKIEEILVDVFNYPEEKCISDLWLEDSRLYNNSKDFEEY